jgi:molecular chaperone HtpG
MKEGQKEIFYIINESRASVFASPFIKSLRKKGYEVLYLLDLIDEYMVKQIKDYEEKNSRMSLKKVMSLMKLRMKKKYDDEKEIFEPLCSLMKDILREKVEKAVIGSRID